MGFADTAGPQLRHAIDSAWSGVLPRSYFIDAQGLRAGHSGALKAQQVLDWFGRTQSWVRRNPWSTPNRVLNRGDTITSR
jgi:hypothetical protein